MAQFPSLTLRQKRSPLWLILSPLVIGVLWSASNVLLPYGLDLVLAYLLLPLVNWLMRRMPRMVRDLFKYFFFRLSEEPLPPEEAMVRVRAGEELQLRV